jgi:hypothetical protein
VAVVLDVNGPRQPLADASDAALQLHQTGHSCIAQHFRERMTAKRTFLPFVARTQSTLRLPRHPGGRSG